MKKRVVVGLSGGVDSSVAAYLCQKAGYEVIGLFMKNWHDDSVTISDECPWLEDSNDAMLVADKLGIPFQTVDLSKAYKAKIVDYMFKEYKSGRTPNPDVLCNREIKFDDFLKVAESLGADYVATGHYCRKESFTENGTTRYKLLAGKDKNKDQSYFLCQISQNQLSKALFPIGDLQKSEVRKIAAELDLVTAEKKDSQGLCFIGKVKLPEFLQQKLKPKRGDIIEVDSDHSVYEKKKIINYEKAISLPVEVLAEYSKPYHYNSTTGKIVGKHDGAHFFTKGQRKGLAVGGTKEPLFVIETDVNNNIIYTGQSKDHPGLNRNCLKVKTEDVHWVRTDLKIKPGESLNVKARIRYRQPLEEAQLICYNNGLFVVFKNKQSAITEGQFVAWYHDDELLGSGVIS
ncbi:tRNA (5-methylaminomethyl-2-thiouridylate)-methyltransferase [Psychroflexus salarius]|uniref:tRNA-specific 2-thiouridylase MnmA n=1 Tax=Psychroflexus salarius TaxID=1155689 RepID=A0A1M4U163_9FLAO|nr:tRNA 2-thiouridine(34) synthase MnmA [Psychroflexus salarius]SHE50336.1 tRNA (5-methylaminomethyl-2-thiouridylate)-methyltransferase [Psychroflexus salarius]